MIHLSQRLAFFGLTTLIGASINAKVVDARPPVNDMSSSSKAAQLSVSEQTIGSGWQTVITPTSPKPFKPRASACQPPIQGAPSATCAEVIRSPNAAPQSQLVFSTPPSQQTINLFPIDPLPSSVRFLNIASP